MAKTEEPDETQVTDDVYSYFTCEICAEPAQSIKKFTNSTLCGHPFCLDCIAKYIKARVEDGAGAGAATIKCPALGCNNPLDPLSCQPVIPKDLFVKWCDRLCDSAVSGIEKCYCPHTTCSTLVLNECKDKAKKAYCPNCKRDFYFECKFPLLAGNWFSETGQTRDVNDILFERLVEQRRWIRCYKCGHVIEKNGGCSSISCRCGTSICHRCGKQYHYRRPCEDWDKPTSCWEILEVLCFG